MALISLNRPDRLNAITGELTARLKEKIDDACKDDDVKVIVLTGSGRGFSAGADMDNLSDISANNERKIQTNLKTEIMKPMVYQNGKDLQLLSFCTKADNCSNQWSCCRSWLIMSLYCDMRVASEDAVFSTAFSKRGLIAEWGWLDTARIIGVAHTMDIMMTARKFDAKEAERIGLVIVVFLQKALWKMLCLCRRYCANVSQISTDYETSNLYCLG